MTEDGDGFTGLTTAKNAFEAGAITALLGASGIEARTVALTAHTENQSGLAPGMSPFGALVLVRAHDLDAAEEALERGREDAAKIDWSTVDVGVPLDATAARIARRDVGSELFPRVHTGARLDALLGRHWRRSVIRVAGFAGVVFVVWAAGRLLGLW